MCIIIITPSCRPKNLIKIKDSIDFDYIRLWIIVYDQTKIKKNPQQFKEYPQIVELIHTSPGISGNPQRNFGLDFIEANYQLIQQTYIYFLDDDNIVHPNLFKRLSTLKVNKIYSFNQLGPQNGTKCLKGTTLQNRCIDTAMVLFDSKLCQGERWQIEKYDADGIFIENIYKKNKDKHIYIDEDLSYYNKLSE